MQSHELSVICPSPCARRGISIVQLKTVTRTARPSINCFISKTFSIPYVITRQFVAFNYQQPRRATSCTSAYEYIGIEIPTMFFPTGKKSENFWYSYELVNTRLLIRTIATKVFMINSYLFNVKIRNINISAINPIDVQLIGRLWFQKYDRFHLWNMKCMCSTSIDRDDNYLNFSIVSMRRNRWLAC